jgi:hypothetical protein
MSTYTKTTTKQRKSVGLHRPGPNMGFIPYSGKNFLAEKKTGGAFGTVGVERMKRMMARANRNGSSFESRVSVHATIGFQARMVNGQIRNLKPSTDGGHFRRVFTNCGETFTA